VRKRVRLVQDHLAPPLIDEGAYIEDLPPTSKPPPPRPPARFAFPVAFGQADGQLVAPGCEDERAGPRRIYLFAARQT
jgi:hypothetical protein